MLYEKNLINYNKINDVLRIVRSKPNISFYDEEIKDGVYFGVCKETRAIIAITIFDFSSRKLEDLVKIIPKFFFNDIETWVKNNCV